MFSAGVLPAAMFAFGSGQGPDKFRGLQQFGPYRPPERVESQHFGFVFPNECRDQANRLYLALKNGIGYFRGIESAFRVPFRRENVFAISGFSLDGKDPRDSASAYTDAILRWHESAGLDHLFFFVIHPRTSRWQGSTPYYESKATLLQNGILSQDVTTNLIDNPSEFQWSVGNIGLAVFAKLGGIPWVVSSADKSEHLVLGIGRAALFDVHRRDSTHHIAFTACFKTTGVFEFLSFAKLATNRADYLGSLGRTLRSTLDGLAGSGRNVASVTLHVPKIMGNDELGVIRQTISSSSVAGGTQPAILKVTDAPEAFGVDPEDPDGVPPRGLVIQLGDNDFLLYTEGREESQSWRRRTPTVLRIVPLQGAPVSGTSPAIAHVNQLSQVNWRGFNANSRPISVYYAELIAQVLSHLSPRAAQGLYQPGAMSVLQHRMWFL